MKQARSMTARSHRQWLQNKDGDEPDSQSVSVPSTAVPWTNQSINELSMEYAYENTALERKARLLSYGSMIDRYTRAMNVKRVKHPQLYQSSIDAQQAAIHDDHQSYQSQQHLISPVKPAKHHISINRPLSVSLSVSDHHPIESHTISITEPQPVQLIDRPRSVDVSQLDSQQQHSQHSLTSSANHHRRSQSATSNSSATSLKPRSLRSHIEPVMDPNGPITDESSVKSHRKLLALEDRLQLAHAISSQTSSALHKLRPRLLFDHPPMSHHHKDLSPAELKAEHDRNQRDRLNKLESMTSSLQESRNDFTHTASTIIANQKKLILKDKQRHLSNKHRKSPSMHHRSQLASSSHSDSSDDESTNAENSHPLLIAEIIRQPSSKLFSSTLQRSLERSKRTSPVADTIRGSALQRSKPDCPKSVSPAANHRPQTAKPKPTATSVSSSADIVNDRSKQNTSVKQLTSIAESFIDDRFVTAEIQPFRAQTTNQERHIPHLRSTDNYRTSIRFSTLSDTAVSPSFPTEESKEVMSDATSVWQHQDAHDRLAQIEARLAARWTQEQPAKAKRSASRVRFSEELDE